MEQLTTILFGIVTMISSMILPAHAQVENKPATGIHKKFDSEERMVAVVRRQYKKYGSNVSGLKPGCFGFSADGATGVVTETEVHNKTCGGDTATSPIVARFKVDGQKVMIVDPVSGKDVPFDKSFKSDGP